MTDAIPYRPRPAAMLRRGIIALCLTLLSSTGLANGIGGTGQAVAQQEGSGIGGTGSPAARREGSGIGGTGQPVAQQEGSGIGGTGIVGIITGFGSIWVNGIEVHYGDDAVVDTPNGPRGPADLAIGQRVLVASERQGSRIQARTIQLLPAVAGPVTAATPGENRYVIAGQTVQFGKNLAGLPTPRVGDWLSVSGLRRSDDTIMASSATPYPRSAPILVYGPLSTGEDSSLRIQKLSVILPPGATSVQAGSHVLVRGALEGDRLVVREIHDNPVGRLAAATHAVSLQGYVQASRQDELRIASVDVRFSQVPGATMAAPAVDELVQVEAYRDDDGILRIDHIETLSADILGLDSLDTEPHRGDVTEHESEAPEAGDREVESPEPDSAETATPEQEATEAESPEVERPEVETPEVETPETEVPEVATPEAEVPEVETPELEAPEVETPEVETPEMETPEVEVPEVDTPETESPEIAYLRPSLSGRLLVESVISRTLAPATITTPIAFRPHVYPRQHPRASHQSHPPRRS